MDKHTNLNFYVSYERKSLNIHYNGKRQVHVFANKSEYNSPSDIIFLLWEHWCVRIMRYLSPSQLSEAISFDIPQSSH